MLAEYMFHPFEKGMNENLTANKGECDNRISNFITNVCDIPLLYDNSGISYVSR